MIKMMTCITPKDRLSAAAVVRNMDAITRECPSNDELLIMNKMEEEEETEASGSEPFNSSSSQMKSDPISEAVDLKDLLVDKNKSSTEQNAFNSKKG